MKMHCATMYHVTPINPMLRRTRCGRNLEARYVRRFRSEIMGLRGERCEHCATWIDDRG
jgi:branched-subunit amino acid ABC-type transport system permease component